MAPDGDQRTGGGLSPSIDPLADGGGKYSLGDQCTRPARATPCGVSAPTHPTCSSSVPCMLLTAWRSVCSGHSPPWPRRETSVRRPTRHQCSVLHLNDRSTVSAWLRAREQTCEVWAAYAGVPSSSGTEGASTICRQCVPCSRRHRDVPESIGSWTLADRRLIRKSRFVVSGHCHDATAIHGHTGGEYRSKRKSSGISFPQFHQYRFCQRRYSRNR